MLKTVVSTLGLALAACSVGAVDGVGDDDTDAGGGDPRSASFTTDVVPLVMNAGCLNASCHGGLQNPQMSTFDKMTSNGIPGRYLITPSAMNVLITKDAGTPGQHPTAGAGIPYLTATDKTAIATWLDSAP